MGSKLAKWRTLLPVMAPIILSSSQGSANVVASRGGSDFLFFDLHGCERDRFSVLPNYDKNKEDIDARLTSMFRNGQRKLRTAIPLPDNLLGDSPASSFDENYITNIRDFLSSIRDIGFDGLEVGFGSVGNPPFKWSEWHEDLYLRRWQAIVKLRPLLVASGLRYYIDLLNEGIPAANQPVLLRYTQRLWTDYTRSFGKKDTVGFSIITTPNQDRFKQLPQVYGDNPPDVFDLHIYDDPYRSFSNAHRRLSDLGYSRVPWIIGEAYYNDSAEADAIARAIQDTQQKVLFLLDWPLRKARKCDDVDVVPLDFGEYMKRGF